MSRIIILSLFFVAGAAILLFLIAPGALDTGVIAITIDSRESFAEGELFGDVGAYEWIRGRLTYAVDPDDKANDAIVDLEYAPRDEEGRVVFHGEFELLKPVDLSKGNHCLLYDVNNRGNKVILGNHNGAWGNDPGPGNGFLMRHGYTILWTGWNWDVVPAAGLIQIDLPVATIDGVAITQMIAAEMVPSFATEIQPTQRLAWGNSRCYPPVDPLDTSEARLTVRDAPRAERTEIPREQWWFARMEEGEPVPDSVTVYIDSGFEPGRIYELVYPASNPRVVGLGLAAVRDAISFFRFETEDSEGNTNPLAVDISDGTLQPDPNRAYIYGTSQSGRFITHMIWQGLHVDTEDRMVFEGARIHVAGGGKGGFNHRFAQTTHHPSHLEGNYFPADHPPFNFLAEDDPESGGENDVLAVAKRLEKVPYIIITNNELEYWTRSASLVTTDLTATRDASVHEKVRIYTTNGAPHRGRRSRDRGIHEHPVNPLDVSPVLRATLVALDEWVVNGTEPPDSRYPRLDREQLIPAAEHKQYFPVIPGARHPGRNLQPPRVDYGPRFWSEGIFTVVPPQMGEPYPTLVPAYDEDGNGFGGIRLPEIAVPLGTYQGWNPRQARYGAPDYLGRFEGSFWVFPATEAERSRSGDSRRSLAARYPSKESYVEEVKEVCADLFEQGYLLIEDVNRYVADAERLAWPPEPIDETPFWKMESD